MLVVAEVLLVIVVVVQLVCAWVAVLLLCVAGLLAVSVSIFPRLVCVVLLVLMPGFVK